MIRTLLGLVLIFAAAACGERTPNHAWPAPAPAVWEITSPSGQRGWLFGTIHALPAEVRWRTPALDAAMDEARLLVVEVADLDDEAAATTEFERLSQSAGLPPMLQRVSPAARPALADALERAGLDEEDLAGTESWAAALTILNSGRARENGNGVDRALLREGLPVAGLETHARLFGLFDALAPDDQRQLLELAAKQRGSSEERALTADWLAGDLPALARRLNSDILADPELREALLEHRNAAWLPLVISFVEHGRQPFVAVGTAHLIGDVGLPSQLAARGYSVRRVQ